MLLPMDHSVFCFICLQEEPFALCRSLAGEPKAVADPGNFSPSHVLLGQNQEKAQSTDVTVMPMLAQSLLPPWLAG